MQRLLRDIIPHIYSKDETQMYLLAVQLYVRMSDNNTFLLIRYPEISSDPDPDHQRADGDHDDTDGDTRGDTRPGHW